MLKIRTHKPSIQGMNSTSNTALSRKINKMTFVAALLFSQLGLAQQTSLNMVSETGDYIGQGQIYALDENDGTFTASVNYDNGINVNFTGPTGSFGLNFAPKEGADFIMGPYPGATRFPFQSPTTPGMNASGFGRGCNESFSDFTVLEVVTDNNDNVISFAADFTQHCGSIDAPALTGEVRFNSAGQPFPPAPDNDLDSIANTIDNCTDVFNTDQIDTDRDGLGDVCDDTYTDTFLVLNSEEGDYIGQGEYQELFLLDGNITAQRNFDNGVTINFNGYDSWTLNFAAPGNVDLTAGSYELATEYPFQAINEPGLSVYGAGRGCSISGRFDVLSVVYDSFGEVESFVATFEQYCRGSSSALLGEVRFNAVPQAPELSGSHYRQGRNIITTLNWVTEAEGVDVYYNGQLLETITAANEATYYYFKKFAQEFMVCNIGTDDCSVTYVAN